MNGIHDMGGMHGMGPIEVEENEPVFHERWEGRTHAITRATGAWQKWNIDSGRFGIERISPEEYLRMSYYERWFVRTVGLLVKTGMISEAELASGTPDPASPKETPPLLADRVPAVGVDRGIAPSNDPEIAPLFQTGQQVRARNINPAGHTRLPRYARGKVGEIYLDHGVYVFPDTNAHGLGEKRQHVYSVRFTARELWGSEASLRDFIHLDLWDDYLERL